MNVLSLSLSRCLRAGAKAPARGGQGAKPSGIFLWGLLADPLLAGLKRLKNDYASLTQKNFTHQKPQTFNHPITTTHLNSHSPSPLLFLAFVSLALFASSACSTSSHKDQHLLRVLQREEDVLTALKRERTKSDLTEAIAPNPILSNSEMRLIEALTELQEANKLVREALQTESKEKRQ